MFLSLYTNSDHILAIFIINQTNKTKETGPEIGKVDIYAQSISSKNHSLNSKSMKAKVVGVKKVNKRRTTNMKIYIDLLIPSKLYLKSVKCR